MRLWCYWRCWGNVEWVCDLGRKSMYGCTFCRRGRHNIVESAGIVINATAIISTLNIELLPCRTNIYRHYIISSRALRSSTWS